jgi:hypothetical protein
MPTSKEITDPVGSVIIGTVAALIGIGIGKVLEESSKK